MRSFQSMFVIAALVSAALAGTPLGTVASSGPVLLSGTQIAPSAVPSWPLVSGDEVATTSSPAVIRLRDRTIITLNENSRVRLLAEGSRTNLSLSQGSISFKLVSGTQVQIFALDRILRPQAGSEGMVSIRKGKVVTSSQWVSSNRAAPAIPRKPKSKGMSKPQPDVE